MHFGLMIKNFSTNLPLHPVNLIKNYKNPNKMNKQ
jgi:hypothetical protein